MPAKPDVPSVESNAESLSKFELKSVPDATSIGGALDKVENRVTEETEMTALERSLNDAPDSPLAKDIRDNNLLCYGPTFGQKLKVGCIFWDAGNGKFGYERRTLGRTTWDATRQRVVTKQN